MSRTPRQKTTTPQAPPPIITEEPRTAIGKFMAEYPTDGRELCLLWEMPPESLQTETVKVTRFTPGTNQTNLYKSIVLQDYDMADIAATCGPGRYMLKMGPGQFRARTCELNISEHYAREAGWQDLPPLPPRRAEPMPSDRFLVATAHQATREPVPEGNIALMLELAVAKALQAAKPPEQNQQVAIMSGFEMALKMMEMARATVDPTQANPAEPESLAGVAMKYAPQIIDLFKQGLNLFSPAQTSEKRTEAAPTTTKTLTTTAPPAPAPEEPLPLPPLTPEEINAINPIIGVLHEFAPRLISALNSPLDAQTLGEQLAGMIGPDLEDSALALAKITAAHGPNVLGTRFRELATPKAAEVIRTVARIIQEGRQE